MESFLCLDALTGEWRGTQIGVFKKGAEDISQLNPAERRLNGLAFVPEERNGHAAVIADLTLSFDNVLAVVAASKGNFHIMVVGLLLSVFLIATLAGYFADFIKRHQWLGYLGLAVILLVALQLIIGGLVNYEVLSINEKYEFLFAI